MVKILYFNRAQHVTSKTLLPRGLDWDTSVLLINCVIILYRLINCALRKYEWVYCTVYSNMVRKYYCIGLFSWRADRTRSPASDNLWNGGRQSNRARVSHISGEDHELLPLNTLNCIHFVLYASNDRLNEWICKCISLIEWTAFKIL